jgi:NO-binding membrane sensor protein with MHYT domain
LHFPGFCFTDATGMPFAHDVRLVAVSYLIATIGSYTALEMAERLRGATGAKARFWLASSAATLGGSIWAMHFMGLLALEISLPINYDPGATILSLIIAIAAAATGLQLVRSGALSVWRFILAGTVVGFGVAAMHYVGMAALLFPGTAAYRPGLWTLSVLIAIAAAIVALWLSMTLQATWQRAVAALVMAAAICGMHYTGMQSTEFLVDVRVGTPAGIAAGPLAVAVGGVTLTLLVLAILVAADRRLLAAAQHQAETLRADNIELTATQRKIVRRLWFAGEFRDNDTGKHVERIGLMAHRLALTAGFDTSFAEALLMAAPLHDIGNAYTILLKPGELDPHGWEEMQKHAEIGHTILDGSGVKLLGFADEIALHHHERWDGIGYPGRLAAEAIPLSSRIVAIVDVFDALLSRRPYKKPWPVDKVVAHIHSGAGAHFDPKLVETFLEDLPAMLDIRAHHA